MTSDVTKPRQLAPTVGPAVKRVTFRAGSVPGTEDLIVEHLHQYLAQARGESMEKFDRGIRDSTSTTPLTRGLQDSSNVRVADITDGDSELISTIPSVERCAIEFPSSCPKGIGFRRLDLRGRLKH